jgi:hypothetical protein
MHTAWNPSHCKNETYQELCAIAAIGELSPSEFEELQQHLMGCSDCRELYADFRRLASDSLGMVAILKETAQAEEAAEPLDERALLGRLLDRANQERALHFQPSTSRLPVVKKLGLPGQLAGVRIWFRRPALSYGAVALILCAGAAIGAFRLRELQLTPTFNRLHAQLQEWKNHAEASDAQQESMSQSLRQAQSERETLHKSLLEGQAKYEELLAQERSLAADLADAQAQLGERREELEASRRSAAEKDGLVAKLESQLQDAIQRAEAQKTIAAELRSRLHEDEQTAIANTPESQSFDDAEARGLFGARDLHIVDVYDVESSGKTRRTYGRVFYVEKKLLIFYAFDLRGRKRNSAPVAFQAWGYQQADENRPENLGLFSLDDASMNRWVLKVNNPRVLAHIDAVFVTAEPHNGSPFPRGRKLLYANLAVPPNHP